MFDRNRNKSKEMPRRKVQRGTQHRSRPAFTLVELLMVIMLIGILASFVLVALARVTQSAKEDRTKAQIMKIHELLMERWEQYRYRRVPATPAMTMMRTSGGNINNRAMAFQRLIAIRELMRMELPTFKSDVESAPVFLRDPLNSTLPFQPATWRAYRNRAASAAWDESHQQAECLYLILSRIRDADSSALEYFRETEIGDVDGDGMKEILDAWGNPIQWMLWAPGYTSPMQRPLWDDKNGDGSVTPEELDPEQQDMLDPANVGSAYQNTTFAGDFATLPRTLYPLVYSAGPDGKFGIILSTTSVSGNTLDQNWPAAQNDPYNRDPKLKMFRLGAVSEQQPEALADDISNHYLTTR